jgi:hypothetical protein
VDDKVGGVGVEVDEKVVGGGDVVKLVNGGAGGGDVVKLVNGGAGGGDVVKLVNGGADDIGGRILLEFPFIWLLPVLLFNGKVVD